MRRGRERPPVLATVSTSSPPGDARAWRLRRADYDALAHLHASLGAGRTVLFTGAERGKSAAAVGFATVAAANGRRVALLECDLAQPSLAGELGLRAAPGLREYLLGEADAQQILQSLILAGPASAGAVAPLICVVAGAFAGDGAALLASDGFSHAIGRLRDAYDLVVVDGPPIGRRDDDSLIEVARRMETTLACVTGSKLPRRTPVAVAGLVSLD